MRTQMTRWLLVLTLFVAIGACRTPGAANASKPDTVQSVALQSADVAGLQRCGESGSLATVLAQEKADNPMAYSVNATEWEQWRRVGAQDAYFAVFGRTAADCASLTQAGTGAPKGGLMAELVVGFKTDSVATRSYNSGSTLFGFGPRDMTFIRLSGGIVTTGSTTGLGADSAVGRASVLGTTYYFAFWQKKVFDSYLVAYDVQPFEADIATSTANDKIH
jgi:hypothetical protein